MKLISGEGECAIVFDGKEQIENALKAINYILKDLGKLDFFLQKRRNISHPDPDPFFEDSEDVPESVLKKLKNLYYERGEEDWKKNKEFLCDLEYLLHKEKMYADAGNAEIYLKKEIMRLNKELQETIKSKEELKQRLFKRGTAHES